MSCGTGRCLCTCVYCQAPQVSYGSWKEAVCRPRTYLHGVAGGDVRAKHVALVLAVGVDEVVGEGGAALEVVHDVTLVESKGKKINERVNSPQKRIILTGPWLSYLVHVPEADGGLLGQHVEDRGQHVALGRLPARLHQRAALVCQALGAPRSGP